MTRNSKNSSILHVTTSRRGFLRGTTVAAAGGAAIVALGNASAAGPGIAVATPGTVTKLEAMTPDGNGLYVERVSGRTLADLDKWRPTGHIYVKNTSGSTLDTAMVFISYQGNNPPTGRLVPFQKAIAPGSTLAIPIPEDRLLPMPVANSISVQVGFAQPVPPAAATRTLVQFQHNSLDGTFPFPTKGSDLPAGQYYATSGNHGYDSNHGNTSGQRFAYDIHVRRWTGAAWSSLKAGTDGTEPEHYLCWGQPVYAMANAKIVAGWRLREDDPIDVDTSPGGNGFWMQLDDPDAENGTYALYAHLMKESIPPELVPVEGGPGPVVAKGQFLGLIGKSGTKKPHLHFHIQRGISKYVTGAKSGYGQGLPFRFSNIEVREWQDAEGTVFDPDLGNIGWKWVTGAGVGENMLINPDGPIYTGGIQVGPWGSKGLGLADKGKLEPNRASLEAFGLAFR